MGMAVSKALRVGHEVSRFVANHFIEELKKNTAFEDGDIAKALEQTFKRMDEMIQENQRELNEIRKNSGNSTSVSSDEKIGGTTGAAEFYLGCTANVAVFDDKHYYVANSGDSRAALSRGQKLVILSEDHKPETEKEKKRIEKAGGVIMNGRVNGGLNLTRALGDFDYKCTSHLPYHEQMITCHPDVTVVARHPDDEFIIMGCDGIWERYVEDSQHMIDYLVMQRNMAIDSRILLENMLKGMLAKCTSEEIGCDNMSSILIEFVRS